MNKTVIFSALVDRNGDIKTAITGIENALKDAKKGIKDKTDYYENVQFSVIAKQLMDAYYLILFKNLESL